MAGRQIRLSVGRHADIGSRIVVLVSRTILDEVVAGNVAVDVLLVITGVRVEVDTSRQGSWSARVHHHDTGGSDGGAVKLVESVRDTGVGEVIPDVVGVAVLQPSPAPHVTLDELMPVVGECEEVEPLLDGVLSAGVGVLGWKSDASSVDHLVRETA